MLLLGISAKSNLLHRLWNAQGTPTVTGAPKNEWNLFLLSKCKSLLNQAKYTTIHVRNTTLLNIFTAVGRGGSVKVQMRDLPQTNTC